MRLIVYVIFHINVKAPECKASAWISVTTEILLQFKKYISISRKLDFKWNTMGKIS